MNVTVDIGNTHQTFLKDSGKVSPLSEFNIESTEINLWVSSVNDQILKILPKNKKMIRYFFKDGFLNDMPVSYTQTIGDDRLAAAYFLFKKNQLKKLHIDTGTFTTIDLITKNGFEGGFILPGLQSLSNTYTNGKNLHKPSSLELNFSNQEIPHNTEDAIKLGCLITYLAPIKELINLFHPEEIYLSGGNANFLSKHINLEDLKIEDHIIHKGLRRLSEDLK